MATNFPTGTDNFGTPNNPGSTALSSAGTSARNHVQSHKDLGDAVVAMQVQATLAIHSHDGVTARHGSKLAQANTHQSPDTDSAAGSLHHTLGHLVNQAAPGNHASLQSFQDTHAATVTWPVGSVFIATVATNPGTLLGIGTWSQITDAFLIGAGGSYTYTGSVVAATTTHSHTIADTSTNSDGSHTHTMPSPTDTQGAHTHTGGTTGATSVSHTHSSVNNPGVAGLQGAVSNFAASGSGNDGNAAHGHTMGSSTSTSHSHSVDTYNSSGGHSHTVASSTGSQTTHTHSVTTDTPSHLPPWKAFYVWKRTA